MEFHCNLKIEEKFEARKTLQNKEKIVTFVGVHLLFLQEYILMNIKSPLAVHPDLFCDPVW